MDRRRNRLCKETSKEEIGNESNDKKRNEKETCRDGCEGKDG